MTLYDVLGRISSNSYFWNMPFGARISSKNRWLLQKGVMFPPRKKTSITQWFVSVLVSRRDHMTQKPILIYTWYIIGIYGPLGDYMLPPVTRTEETPSESQTFSFSAKEECLRSGKTRHSVGVIITCDNLLLGMLFLTS